MSRIVILGAGESGVGAARLAKKHGYEVFVSDKGPVKKEYKEALISWDISFEEEQHTTEKILNASEIVKSPGIPEKADLIQQAYNKGIPVISEIEFASRYTRAKIIGITGSNGKTTTTKLTGHLLQSAGIDAAIGGNVGLSFAGLVAEKDYPVFVLELSSFQLDGIKEFRPDVAVLLNITPDHLDRYGYKMENYVRSKFRIGMNQHRGDMFIYNSEDTVIRQYLNGIDPEVEMVPVSPDLFKDGKLFDGEDTWFDMTKCRLKGPHNMLNAICAVKSALAVGASREGIQQGLDTFVNAPHRLEVVETVGGVEFINDSKATNVDSVYWALRAMDKPVVLILGGQDKGNDYTPILPLVKEKVKGIVCMGLDNEKIVKVFSPILSQITETRSAEEAVQVAFNMAEPGDVVLLSPACASFDLFNNYEHRGEMFKKAVRNLREDK